MIKINQETVNKTEVQQQANKAANNYAFYQGEVLVKPIMFNPTQEDFDKLGVENIKLFDDHYTNTTQEGEKFTTLSLLFEYSPSELLADDSYPDKRFGMYNIAISDEDLVEYNSGVAQATGQEYAFWKVQLVDGRLNTMTLTLNEDPKGKKIDWIRSQAKESVDIKNSYKIASMRYNGNFYDLDKETKRELANEVDLLDLKPNEFKRLDRFNPATCIIQKQGYVPYLQLLLNMSALNISYFNPLKQDIAFDAKGWTKLVKGDVTALNKSYNKDAMYRYTDDQGKPTSEKPLLGVFMYTKLKSNGYHSQEVLSPSYPGFYSSWNATFTELTRARVQKGRTWEVFGKDALSTCLELYPLRGKLLGLRFDGTVDESAAIVKYPYDFTFNVYNTDNAVATTDSATESNETSNTVDDDDMPF